MTQTKNHKSKRLPLMLVNPAGVKLICATLLVLIISLPSSRTFGADAGGALTAPASTQTSSTQGTSTPKATTTTTSTVAGTDETNVSGTTTSSDSGTATSSKTTEPVIPKKITATPFTDMAPGEKESLGRPLSEYEKTHTIQKKDQVVDEGTPENPPKKANQGNQVVFHVIMKLETGKVIFDSKKDGRAWKGVIGNGSLIGGLDFGLRGMAEGDKRSLWIPSHMAYGANGIEPQVPPHSKIYAEVEMIRIEDPQ